MKKELIKLYNEGTIKDFGYYNPSMFDAYIVVQFDEDYVFGYYTYNEKKDFFLVKTKILNEGFSFKVKGRTLNSNNFMRINF